MMLFASDVHLSESAPAVTDCFLNFLSGPAIQARAVFLLGDLFDVWVGDDSSATWVTPIVTALSSLTAANVPVFIQRGNRDFLLGGRFMRTTGCSLLPDEYALSHPHGRYLLMHGDQLTGDSSYQRYRRFGWPLLSLAAVCLPVATRRRVAAALRRASRGGSVLAEFNWPSAIRLLSQHNCQYMIHGHFHRREEVSYQSADGGEGYRRFCLPDWHNAPGYAALTDAGTRFYALEKSSGEC